MVDRVLKIARGEEKAELVIKKANIINVFTNEIIKGDVAIDKGRIVAIGQYSGWEEIDLKGKYLSPAFIDSHVHIESSKVTPGQFAKAVVPRGVTSIIADPHEIANVKGIEGIEYMLEESENIPLDVYMMLPSCVPATPFESAGAVLEAKELAKIIDKEGILGMGEMMDYVGVINGDEKVLEKIELAKEKGKIIDGHGPMITGRELNAYVAAGIRTEHECSTVKEMVERLRLGMYIHIREGSAARNLKELIKAVNKDNLSRVMFCTDDKEPSDLLENGSIDNNIRLAIEAGIDPIDCIKIASLNPALAYGLEGKGAIAPGYRADLVVIDNLIDFNILMVFKDGKLVAENYMPLFHVTESSNTSMKNTVVIKPIKEEDLKLSIKGDKVNVIGVIPDSLITEKLVREVGKDIVVEGGEFVKGNDILKVAVIERHKATGRIGLGLVEGFGLENGAIASTIAHDSHNIIVIGDRDSDMVLAVEELKRLGGGIALAQEGKIIGSLQLEIAGLMSDKPLEEVRKGLDEILQLAYDKLRVNKNIEPFMILSFLALPVIPSLKITDLGLFDVDKFKFINLEVK